MLESSIALYERATGNVGIGRSKGKSASQTESSIGFQTIVPGIEHMIRAEGTTAEPHILGEYFAMILPLPFVLVMIPGLRTRLRFVAMVVLVMGLGGFVVTFSRSGWLSFTIASTIALGLIVFMWKHGKALIIVTVIVIVASLAYPQAYDYVYTKLIEAPEVLIKSRLDMMKTALSMWHTNFLFGVGPSNYMHALDYADVAVYEEIDRTYIKFPVHNMFLYFASETGLCGVIAFFGIIFTSIRYCWKMLRCNDLLIRVFALAIMTGFIAYLLDGVTNCLGRQAVVYAHLWAYIGLAASFKYILNQQQDNNYITEETF